MRGKVIILIEVIFVMLFCVIVFYLGYTLNKKNITTTNINIIESSLEKSIDKIYDATVTIQNYSNGLLIGTGSGFVYKEDDEKGYILTNYHVISEGTIINVTYNNDKVVTANLLGYDELLDIAVLSVSKEGILKIATFGDSEKLKLGDTLIAIGTPADFNYKGTISKGIVSALDRYVILNDKQEMMKVIQTDAAINPGNSGGPLININGDVIGINSLKLGEENDIEGISFAIPITDIKKYLTRLEKKEEIVRGNLDIDVVNLSESSTINRLGLTSDGQVDVGVMIIDVAENITTLEKGNIIIAIDDIEIKNTNHFNYIISKYDVNDEISIRYYDGKSIKTIKLKLS